jgi:hypothetical protein
VAGTAHNRTPLYDGGSMLFSFNNRKGSEWCLFMFRALKVVAPAYVD